MNIYELYQHPFNIVHVCTFSLFIESSECQSVVFQMFEKQKLMYRTGSIRQKYKTAFKHLNPCSGP